jgi:hypothetical protein
MKTDFREIELRVCAESHSPQALGRKFMPCLDDLREPNDRQRSLMRRGVGDWFVEAPARREVALV